MLQGKVALITGASRGVGKETALTLAKAGAKVVLVARTPSDLQEVANQIRANNGEALPVPADVTQPDAVAQMVGETLDTFGQIDILVNNAGVGIFEPVADSNPESWHKVIESNLTGTYLCCKYVLPSMLERKSGQIVNVLSIAAKVPFRASSAYCAAKAGALAFTRVLSEEVRAENIRVTALLPGSIESTFWNGIEPHPDFDLMLKPAHVAETIRWLVSQPAGMVTEEVVVTPPLGIL